MYVKLSEDTVLTKVKGITSKIGKKNKIDCELWIYSFTHENHKVNMNKFMINERALKSQQLLKKY